MQREYNVSTGRDSMTTYANTTEYIKSTSRDYSIYVCQSRGIPSVSDGLKDAQRKALFVIKPMSDKIKTISLAGTMISSNCYLHGDASAADTLSLMAAPYCNNVPFLHGIGAFGTKVGPTEWGAPRYTYLKKSSTTEALIYPDYDIIPLKENYDGSVMEPKHFLPLVPLVLLNGISGIAVGWSTEILPRNLTDLIDACIAALDGKRVPRLTPTYDYLDCKSKDLGNNAWEFQGKVKIDGSTVWIEELPPDMSPEKFKARLNQMEDDDKIQTYIDRSTKEIRIEVRFKRGTIADWTEDQAIDFFKLKSKTTERIVVLDWDGDSIKQYPTAEELLKDFVEWRLNWYRVRYEKMVADTTHALNFQQALKACIDKKLPQFLPTAADKSAVVGKIRDICSKIPLDEDQIDRIASLASYRWARDAYDEICKRISELTATIADHQAVLADPARQRAIYRSELQALKKLPKVDR
jgi:DNA gyrase/topoisomerase IV subunit A